MATQLSAPRTVPAIRSVTVVLVVVVAVCDVAFQGVHRGIMTLLVAVPALTLCLPSRHRHPLVNGGVAFGVALILGALEWRDRPIVVAGTLTNIVLVTLVARHVDRPRDTHDGAMRPVAEAGPAVAPASPDPARAWSHRFGDVCMETRALPAPGEGHLRGVVYDLRATRFGIRLLVAASPDGDAQPQETTAHLLYHWARIADETAGLAEIARCLDTAVTAGPDQGARGFQALLVGIGSDNPTAEVICCGHPPPLLVSDSTVQPLNVMSVLPPLGHFARTVSNLPVYTTSVNLTVGRRLLLDAAVPPTDSPLLESGASVPGELGPGKLLDHLANGLRHRGGQTVLVLVEYIPQGAASLAPVSEGDRAQTAPHPRGQVPLG